MLEIVEAFWRPASSPEAWIVQQLETLGVERYEDLSLLTPGDLMPPPLPAPVCERLRRRYPREVVAGDVSYRAVYDLSKQTVVLHPRKKRVDKPPARNWLPKFDGLRVYVAIRDRVERI